MRIANPIYDCVFKFLMQDKAAAKLIISAITEFDVEEIELRPTELQIRAGSVKDLTVYRLDLAAKIKTDEGSRLVTIEIQKAKMVTDIMRFRRYLGSQYSSEENYEKVSEESEKYQTKRALPIFTIYILGHCLKTYPDIPVIKVKRSYYDNTTKEKLTKKDDFIESLTHDSAIIQVPALSNRRRDRLEKILSIFDQAQVTKETLHILSVNDDADFSQEAKVLARRLQMAIENDEVRQQMVIEDEILTELQEKDRYARHLEETLQSERQLREEEIQLKQEALQKANQESCLKQEALQKADEERRLKEQALIELEKLKNKLSK